MENQEIATSIEKVKNLLANAHSEFLNFQRRPRIPRG